MRDNYEWLADRVMKQKPRNSTVGEPSRGEAPTDTVASAPSKYRNKKTAVGSITFDSKREAARYGELVLLERLGEINGLTLQVRLPLEIEGVKICAYVCDFRYRRLVAGSWETVYEDCKGMRTPVYLLKKKLVRVLLKIEILET